MDSFLINGGNKLFGEIEVSSSKNALLPILACCLMLDGQITLKNVTYFEDINNMIKILQSLGVCVEQKDNYLFLDCQNIDKSIIPLEMTSKLRASIFCLGALLSRTKKARIAYPGGCSIGARPIDIHLSGLECLGAKIIDKHGYITVDASNMSSGTFHLPFPSVGATENLIMSAVFLKGKTTLYGVAKEPEIVDMCNFLNKAGAKIFGAGGDVIEIYGVEKLKGIEYCPIADRIIAGTYLMLPLLCGGEVEIVGANTQHIEPLISLVKRACKMSVKSDRIVVSKKGLLKSFGKIETLPYPHFPTDLQQPFTTLACLAKGTTIITENLFEGRFNHVPELVKMGAKINVCESSLVIQGVTELFGAEVYASDLRAGASLVLAGLCANGYTTIKNANIIDRGYFDLENTLQKVGANIKRIINV